MKTAESSENKIIVLKKNEDHRIRAGHLWVFSNEIASTQGNPAVGDIVTVKSDTGKFIGVGFFHPNSLISVRLLSRQPVEITSEFFQKKILSAYQLRAKIYPDGSAYRIVHGEADFLPGLIIDKYNDLLSVQTFSAGMDMRLPLLCDVLEELFNPKAIIERNEAGARSLEGLPERTGVLRGTAEPTIISEYDIRYTVDLLEGQKTGFFLDQRENRNRLRKYVRKARVLDCFCNDGGFALHAAIAGASQVTGVDVSAQAVAHATENAHLNKCDTNTVFTQSDVFDFLASAKQRGEKYDVINLDPPSFAKSKKHVTQAKQAYKKLHHDALQLLSHGGILATASCAHHIYDEAFLEIISATAADLGKSISLLEWHGAAPDHPVLPAMPETKYLKFGVFKIG